MKNLVSFDDYKKLSKEKDLEVYSSGRIDAKTYVKSITPTHINKDSVKLNLLTVAQYSQGLSLELEQEVEQVEAKLKSNSFHSLVRKYSY